MSTHTPGPWVTGYTDIDTTVHAVDDGAFIADCADGGYDQATAEANARLIAAAPDMLAVLLKLRRGDLHQRVRTLYDEAQAAIAKATKATP